jgi:hypothetical protein
MGTKKTSFKISQKEFDAIVNGDFNFLVLNQETTYKKNKIKKLWNKKQKLNKITYKNFIASGQLRQKTVEYKNKLEKELKEVKCLLGLL